MKEIGGYLEFEQLGKNEYYTDLYRLNLGRTAIVYYLKAMNCRRLLVPYFLCDSVTDKCKEEGIALSYYSIDQDMTPKIDPAEMTSDTWLFLVNYYGQLTDEKILKYKKTYGKILVDHTHSFFQRPLPGIPSVYSCRKYFGLVDGAYLSCTEKLPEIAEQDRSAERMTHVLGRFEGTAGEYYQKMLENAHGYCSEPVKRMSKLTQNLLGALDYEQIKSQRNVNWQYLDQHLGTYGRKKWMMGDGPLAYPLWVKNGITLRKQLAQKKVFVPTYWSNVIQEMGEDTVEYDFAANILALPCDQRYQEEEMQQVAEAVIDALRENGE